MQCHDISMNQVANPNALQSRKRKRKDESPDDYIIKLNKSQSKLDQELYGKLSNLMDPLSTAINVSKAKPTIHEQGQEDIRLLQGLKQAFDMMTSLMDLKTFQWSDRGNLTKITNS